MKPENQTAVIETLESMSEITHIQLRKLIRENKEMKIKIGFLEEENKYYRDRRKKFRLINMAGE